MRQDRSTEWIEGTGRFGSVLVGELGSDSSGIIFRTSTAEALFVLADACDFAVSRLAVASGRLMIRVASLSPVKLVIYASNLRITSSLPRKIDAGTSMRRWIMRLYWSNDGFHFPPIKINLVNLRVFNSEKGVGV